MSVAAAIRRAFVCDSPAPFHPQRYWESRHQSHLGSLRSVGHRLLTDEANAEQYEIKRARVMELIHRYVSDPVGRLMLDAGCGIGLLTIACVELGFEVTGVDFSETAIQEARRRGVAARLLVSPLCDLRLSERFDVIACIDVLLHIVDDQEWHETIGALARHLKSDGVLIILDWFPTGDTPSSNHVRTRSLEEFQRTIGRAGLQIEVHEQLELRHEHAVKDLLAVRRSKGTS